MHWRSVLRFWFDKVTHKERFSVSKRLDAKIRKRFLKTYWEVVRGEKQEWRKSPGGRLAEIIVLDQFSRNMFRLPTPRSKTARQAGGPAQAFMHDPLALALAQESVRVGADLRVPKEKRMFFYMPFMHSESKKVHREAVRLFKKLGNKEALWYERDHKKIIDRFGRYPHRNKTLGRKSTAAEKKLLKVHKGY